MDSPIRFGEKDTMPGLAQQPEQFMPLSNDEALAMLAGPFMQGILSNYLAPSVSVAEFLAEVDKRDSGVFPLISPGQAHGKAPLGMANLSYLPKFQGKSIAGIHLSRACWCAGQGIALFGPEGLIEWANPAFSALTGRASEELHERGWDLFSPIRPDWAMPGLVLETVGAKDGAPLEAWVTKKDGGHVPVAISATTIKDGQRQISHTVAFIADITEQRRKEAALPENEQTHRHPAFYDALTGLPNRWLLADRVDHALVQARRGDGLTAVACLNLDHFKQVNDNFGHEAGDGLLKAAARRLRQCVRRGDTVARRGGDEFTVVLSGISDIGKVRIVLNKILQTMTRPYQVKTAPPTTMEITASIGIAIFPIHGWDAETLFKRADLAMYAVKNRKGDGFQIYGDIHGHPRKEGKEGNREAHQETVHEPADETALKP